VQGGTIDFSASPAVFNTGQVLFGWSRAFRETKDEVFAQAARKASDFLLESQDTDGAWRRHGSRFARAGVNLYDARTAWGLLECYSAIGDERYREAAIRNLDYVLSRQNANGWFPDCCLDDNNRPLLHTIAYTMEGLFEAGILLDDERYITAARLAADAVRSKQRADGGLAGRFNERWQPSARWSCLTANAQTSVVWLRLHQHTLEQEYLDSAVRANRFIMGTQDLSSAERGVRGGVKGSHPIWAEYAPFEFPNWAAKFLCDSLMLELAITQTPKPL
jgi:uncharacterized protein YyaL (SSP411 family)